MASKISFRLEGTRGDADVARQQGRNTCAQLVGPLWASRKLLPSRAPCVAKLRRQLGEAGFAGDRNLASAREPHAAQ